MLLTTIQLHTIIKLSLPHATLGIGVPELHGASRLDAVFLCAKSQFIFMSDWVGSRKTDWFRVSSTPTYPVRLHNWRYAVGFINLNTGGYHA